MRAVGVTVRFSVISYRRTLTGQSLSKSDTTSTYGQFQVLFEHCHELTGPHTERCAGTTDDQKSRQINTRLALAKLVGSRRFHV